MAAKKQKPANKEKSNLAELTDHDVYIITAGLNVSLARTRKIKEELQDFGKNKVISAGLASGYIIIMILAIFSPWFLLLFFPWAIAIFVYGVKILKNYLNFWKRL